ncbi:golgin candidate 1-like [Nicotiana tomentosiformis]|uniref:golgin candidate 1-like n=1 Tax=Nicotiana tomentosiformis TaxID=4098 RepID=UPI00388C53D6
MRSMGADEGATRAVDVAEGDFLLHETVTIVVGDDIEPSSEAPRLVGADVDLSLPSAVMETGETVTDVLDLSRREEASTSRTATYTSLPANERGNDIAEEGDKSGSNIDADDLRMMEEGLTQLEIRLEGPTRTIAIPMDRDLLKNTEDVVHALDPLCFEIEGKTLKEINDGALSRSIASLALRTVILEIKSAQSEKRHIEIFVKLKAKYFEYRGKYRDLCRRFREYDNMQALQDELKKKDDELVKAIKKCNLEECRLQLEALNIEIAEKQKDLKKAKSSHLDARRKIELLELVNRTLRAKWENNQSTARAKEDQLKESIEELEKDNSVLHDRVAALEAEKAQLLAQPSSSHTSDFPNIPRELYKEWIHIEAQLDDYEARVARGYDPATPEADEEDGDEGVDRLEENPWYDIAYPEGEGGDGEGDQEGEGLSGHGDDAIEERVSEGAKGHDGGDQ